MSHLLNGQHLLGGQELTSSNRIYKLCVQRDGNVVVYKHGIPIWASQTHHKGSGPYSLVMQSDNHLCLYGGNGQCIWANGTHGKGRGKAFARMQDDGNFVVYDEAERALWCTRTDGGNKPEDKYQGRGHLLSAPGMNFCIKNYLVLNTT